MKLLEELKLIINVIDTDLSELSDAADEHCDLVPLRPGARRAYLGPDKVLR